MASTEHGGIELTNFRSRIRETQVPARDRLQELDIEDPLDYIERELHFEDRQFKWRDRLSFWTDTAVPKPLFQELHDDGASNLSHNRHAHPSLDTFHQMPGQHDSIYAQDIGKDDNSERFSDSDRLLKNRSRPKSNRRARARYRRKPLRAYYHDARSLFLEAVREMRSLFPLTSRPQTPRKVGIPFVKYDRIPQVSTSIYISEERFWLLLKRFFGLTTSTGPPLDFSPANDEVAYIKNYLRSNPTPIQNGDGGDYGRDLVRICAKLTVFIFRDRKSKRIFLGLCQNPEWEIFQGFGLVQRFYDEVGHKQQHGSIYEYQNEWVKVTSPESIFDES